MTKVMRILADTFRLARWVDQQGRPVGPQCSGCYDGADVVLDRTPAKRRHTHAGTHLYRCRACLTDFTDRSGTPLAYSPVGYREWALAVLDPDRPKARRFADRLAQAPELLARWRAKLDQAGMTPATIEADLARTPTERA